MKLLLQTLIVFFGTLLTAGLVALGEPGSWGRQPLSTALQVASAPQSTEAATVEAVLARLESRAAGTPRVVTR